MTDHPDQHAGLHSAACCTGHMLPSHVPSTWSSALMANLGLPCCRLVLGDPAEGAAACAQRL